MVCDLVLLHTSVSWFVALHTNSSCIYDLAPFHDMWPCPSNQCHVTLHVKQMSWHMTLHHFIQIVFLCRVTAFIILKFMSLFGVAQQWRKQTNKLLQTNIEFWVSHQHFMSPTELCHGLWPCISYWCHGLWPCTSYCHRICDPAPLDTNVSWSVTLQWRCDLTSLDTDMSCSTPLHFTLMPQPVVLHHFILCYFKLASLHTTVLFMTLYHFIPCYLWPCITSN